jgi:nitroimidazol reductase NimA-like FMN-containing flavoprotein (pyridoxamine 5'-phosphate oxidase superfamily)
MKDTPDYAKIRYAKRKVEDDAIAHAILDQGLVAHVGFIAGDRPMVIPMAYARDGDRSISTAQPRPAPSARPEATRCA